MADRLVRQLRRWLAVAALFAGITVVLTFPLIRDIGSAFPNDAGDPALNAWLLWWSSSRLPLTAAWWNAPMFYPMNDSMALSELLIGLLPIAAPVQWLTGNPIAAYNVVFLLSFVLSGLSMYALALDLTKRRDAALLAGTVFAFGPYRMNQLSHIQMLAYYWAPVALLALHRFVGGSGANASRTVTGAATLSDSRGIFWLVVFGVAWLFQALSNGYAMFHLSVFIALWLLWFVRELRTAWRIAIAWLLAALPLLVPMMRYREVHERLHLARDINEIQRFSVDAASVLSAPPSLAIWGGQLLPSHFETALFPGLTVVVVLVLGAGLAFRNRAPSQPAASRLRTVSAVVAAAFLAIALSSLLGPWSIGALVTVSGFHKPFSIALLAGLVWLGGTGWWRRTWRGRGAGSFYAVAAVVMLVLSFGPSPTFLGRQVLYEPPYAWLMRLPGFDVLRVPARFGMLVLLCEAMLVAFAFARWAPAASWRRSIVAAAIGAGVLADGWIRLPLIPAPATLDASVQLALTTSGAKALVELPPGEPVVDFPAFYRGTQHGQALVNGYSGFVPPHYLPFVYAIGHGHERALEELAAGGPLNVAIDRSLHWSGEMESLVSRLGSARPLPSNERWAAFVVPRTARPPIFLGTRLAAASIHANRREQDVARMSDRNIESAWGSGAPQDGGEEVVVDLGSSQIVETIVLSMGAFSFGFPRELTIEASQDRREWQTVWRGETDVPTIRAALAVPELVPVMVEAGSTARFLRLRQTGRDEMVPWWIAELEIYGR